MCLNWFKKRDRRGVERRKKEKHMSDSSVDTEPTSRLNLLTVNGPEKIKTSPEYGTSTLNNSDYSSPSHMPTGQLTDIYKVPSQNHQTALDVVTANGFELGRELGKGSYAVVYKARRINDGLDLACKVMDISSASRGQNLSAKNELFILERVRHPHIIHLYRHFIVETTNLRQVYIFMQLAEGESLSVYMRKVKYGLPEPTAKKMFAQIVSAVHHMHQKGIAHRDLKMGNVLLDRNYDCLVTDFGLSRVSFRVSKGGKIMSTKFCGTVPYMAPEILLTKEYQLEYDPFTADIWALGVILYCIINRGYPFAEAPNMLEQQMCHKIRFSRKMSFEPGPELIELFYKLLEPEADKRITIEKLVIHPWLESEIKQIEEIEPGNSIYSTNTANSKPKKPQFRNSPQFRWSKERSMVADRSKGIG